MKKIDQLILQEINKTKQGRLPFCTFMEVALYHPTEGYYMRERVKLGKSGDFFTNAHVGGVFGESLGRYFVTLCPPSSTWALVEMGGGDGRLIEQVCVGLLKAGIYPDAVHIYLVETSPFHQRVQKERLQDSPFFIQWASCLSDIPVYSFCVIYSNELIDAFPVHPIKRISNTEIAELYIAWNADKGQFMEEWGPFSNEAIEGFIWQFGYDLEIGQSTEINLNAQKWLRDVARWMQSGYLVTIDYGLTTQELLMRKNGTLRYYYQHTMPRSPLDYIGDIDITSHVNFDTLQLWGEKLGLQRVQLLTQSQFLLQSGILDVLSGAGARDPFSEDAKKRRAVQQLIHPDTMGEAFQVLVQRKE